MFKTIKSTFSGKITIYKILTIFILTGVAYLNIYSKSNELQNGFEIGRDSTYIYMTVTPITWNFGNVPTGQTSTRTFIIKNLSNSIGPLIINPVPLAAPYSLSPSGTITIPVNGSVTITVAFSPVTTGSFNQTLILPNNSQNYQSAAIALSGGASNNGIIMNVNYTTLSFGNLRVGQSSTRTFVITNSPLSSGVLTISCAGSYPSQFSVNTSGSMPINPGHSRTFIVTFRPSSNTSYGGSILINNNSTNYSNGVKINLNGRGSIF